MAEGLIVDIIRTFFINIYTYFLALKVINNRQRVNIFKNIFICLIIAIIILLCEYLKNILGFPYIVIWQVLFTSLIFTIKTKKKLINSILIITISLSINYVIFITSIVINFLINKILVISSEYLNLTVILFIHFIILIILIRLKRIKQGLAFLQEKLENEYFSMLILNISIVILFFVIILSNYNDSIYRVLPTGIFIIAIMMFVTIQKSLELYYKQRMLVKDLEETKKELEDKKAEVAELEKENLNFSKISHTIAHRQKSLEHKLEELNMNNEISNEIGARIENVTKDLKKETAVKLRKTGISVIDDMLSYMQSECIKNKIDFQLQLNGNIYTMTNHYIGKDELEILLADHIKDAIIAIGYVDSVNKSILVRLGKIDGTYSLYVYDSGIEFEIDTFMNLGIKPSTTHKDNGGTGMGFMNTFDTLRKYKASLEIEEIGKPCKDNFTKVLKFKFDNKEEFTIKSYRKDEIKKKDKENKLNLI